MLTEIRNCLTCLSAGRFSNCSAREESAIWFRVTCSKPIWRSTRNMNAIEKAEINSHGAHHFELRDRSPNVLLGAMKVLTSRAGSERPPDWEANVGIGVAGKAVMGNL